MTRLPDLPDEPQEPSFEEYLRDHPGPPARKAFREELRQAFLDGDFANTREKASQPPRRARKASVTKVDLEKSIAKRPVSQGARTEFRRELRSKFVSGRLGTSRSFDRSRTPLRLVVGALAAAAAIVLLALLIPREGAWQVELVAGTGTIRIDGVAVDPTSLDSSELALRLISADTVDTRERRISLSRGEDVSFELNPGTLLDSHTFATAGDDGALDFSLHSGEVYIATTSTYSGGPIRITTPQRTVEVTGTVLGVKIYEEQGTCVCVSRGAVRVLGGPEPVDVNAGLSRFIFLDGSEREFPFGDEPNEHVHGLLDHTEEF